MKIISYISSDNNAIMFDDLFAGDIYADKFNLNDIQDIRTFIVRTQTLRDNSHIIFNLIDDEKFDPENIIMAMKRLAAFTVCKPIFILERSEYCNRLAGMLADINISNIIYSDNESEENEKTISSQLQECLSDKPKTTSLLDKTTAINNALQQIAIDNTSVTYSLPQGKMLQIAIAGTKSCAGTTTQSLSISYYLKSIGLKPLIITFDNIFYEKIKFAFDLKENILNVLVVKDIEIANVVPNQTENYNAIIYDFGVLQENEVKHFTQADVSILISTAHAWDLAQVNQAEDFLDKKNHLLWFNFCSGEEYMSMQGWDKLKKATLSRVPYIENPFKPDAIIFYHSHLLPEIKKAVEN